MTTPADLVVVENLIKSYPSREGRGLLSLLRRTPRPRANVLDGIDFTVRRGEILGILGPNGAGKTTLLHTLAALSYWDSGSVTVGGVCARTDPAAVRRLVGLATVDGNFYGRLTVRENLRFFGVLGDVHPRVIEARVAEVLERVGLADRANSQFRTLSTGMRQRVNIARSILGSAQLLLLDEPTRAVDPMNTRSLRRLIRRTLVGELGKTVILTTNLLDEAWELCDRVAILRQGRIHALASPRALQERVSSARRYRIVVDDLNDDLLDRLRLIPGLIALTTSAHGADHRIDVEIEPLERSLTSLLRTVSANGIDVRDVSSEGADPADVFEALAQ